MLKGWKTIIFGALIAGLGTIQATDLVQVIPQGWEDVAMAVIGAIILVLRGATDTPAGNSTPTAGK